MTRYVLRRDSLAKTIIEEKKSRGMPRLEYMMHLKQDAHRRSKVKNLTLDKSKWGTAAKQTKDDSLMKKYPTLCHSFFDLSKCLFPYSFVFSVTSFATMRLNHYYTSVSILTVSLLIVYVTKLPRHYCKILHALFFIKCTRTFTRVQTGANIYIHRR